jgi:hypothetical protein
VSLIVRLGKAPPGWKCFLVALVAENEAFFHRRGTADQPIAFTAHQHVLMLGGLAFDPDQQRTGAGRALSKRSRRRRALEGLASLLRGSWSLTAARVPDAACGFVTKDTAS